MNEREIDWPELIQDMILAVLEIQVQWKRMLSMLT